MNNKSQTKQVRVINLRNVPPALFRRAKVESAKRGITLKQFCFEALKRELEPRSKQQSNTEQVA